MISMQHYIKFYFMDVLSFILTLLQLKGIEVVVNFSLL